MNLTHQTDLALRLLLYVAQQGERPDLVTIAEVARFYQVSHEHLRKVVHRLALAKFLSTSRGRHGGLMLARPPAQINIGDVIEEMERNLDVVDCSALHCLLQGPCTLEHALSEARVSFINTLHTYTLANLMEPAGMQKRFVVHLQRLQSP